jgi:hypothetical protein
LKKVSFKTHEDEYSKEWVNLNPYSLDQIPKKSTTQDENFTGGPLVRSKSVKSFKQTQEVVSNTQTEEVAPNRKLLEEERKLFISEINFEMMSFLFEKVLVESKPEIDANDIEKYYLLSHLYVEKILEKFPKLNSPKYQDQLKITALFLIYSTLMSYKNKIVYNEEKPAHTILDVVLQSLNSDSKSLLDLMSDSSNPNLAHLKVTLFHQKMNQYENFFHLQQIISSTDNSKPYQKRQNWFNKVLGKNIYVINKELELELDTDIEMRKEKIKFQNPSELLDKGKELFASRPIIDFNLFRLLFTQIVDTSSSMNLSQKSI